MIGDRVSALEAPYLYRQADDDLYHCLVTNQFCYLLTAPQLGKSRLLCQVAARLEANRLPHAFLDLDTLTLQVGQTERWPIKLVSQLLKALKLEAMINLPLWLQEHSWLTPLQQLDRLVDWALQLKMAQQQSIILGFDSLDILGRQGNALKSLLALVENWFNRRHHQLHYQRLAVVMAGTLDPVLDQFGARLNLWDVFQAIQVRPFTKTEMEAWQPFLAQHADSPQALISRIAYWTGGQPLLSTLLYSWVINLAKPIAKGQEANVVDKLVHHKIIYFWEAQDDQGHFKRIQNSFLQDRLAADKRLAVYQQVLANRGCPIDQSTEQTQLIKMGLLRANQGQVEVANPIYRAVFTLTWCASLQSRLQWQVANFKADSKDRSVAKSSRHRASKWLFLSAANRTTAASPTGISQTVSSFTAPQALKDLSLDVRLSPQKPETATSLLKAILFWTAGQQPLTQLIEGQIRAMEVDLEVDLNETNHQPIVDRVIQEQFLDGWRTSAVAAEIRNLERLIVAMTPEPQFKLLLMYRQVLKSGVLEADDSPEQRELRRLKLLIQHQGMIKIANRLYQAIFNLTWVDQNLLNLRRIYGRRFLNWLDSGFQDHSMLLTGKHLERVQTWSRGKQLSQEEYDFIISSMVYNQ